VDLNRSDDCTTFTSLSCTVRAKSSSVMSDLSGSSVSNRPRLQFVNCEHGEASFLTNRPYLFAGSVIFSYAAEDRVKAPHELQLFHTDFWRSGLHPCTNFQEGELRVEGVERTKKDQIHYKAWKTVREDEMRMILSLASFHSCSSRLRRYEAIT
jgi:hypothetical protein